MRRFAFIAITALALVALAAPGVDARHGSGHNSHTATFMAQAKTGAQGGTLKVSAKVKHARKGAAFSATATVHFASGDQTVQLKRHGKSFTAAAKVPVASDETPGAVPVDVTFSYDEQEQEVETEGTVEDDQNAGDDQGDDQNAGDDQGDDDQQCDATTTTCPGDDQGDDDGNNGGDD